MAKPIRQPGSLRSIGISTLAVDKLTRAKLDELRGDTPMAHFIRELVDKEAEGTQGHLGGIGEPPATLASIAKQTKENTSLLRVFSEFVSLLIGAPYDSVLYSFAGKEPELTKNLALLLEERLNELKAKLSQLPGKATQTEMPINKEAEAQS